MVSMSKKKLTSLLALLMVGIIGIGVTLALYIASMDPVVNHFTMLGPDNVGGEIVEEGWVPGTSGKDAKPGSVFEKGVHVINKSTGDDMPIWVAVRMTIKKGPESAPVALANTTELDQILAVMTPVFGSETANPIVWYNSAKWTRVGKSATDPIGEVETFIYQEKVTKAKKSDNLFDKVLIKKTAGNTEVKAINDMGGFNIVMTGAVVQGDIDNAMTPEIEAQLVGILDGTIIP